MGARPREGVAARASRARAGRRARAWGVAGWLSIQPPLHSIVDPARSSIDGRNFASACRPAQSRRVGLPAGSSIVPPSGGSRRTQRARYTHKSEKRVHIAQRSIVHCPGTRPTQTPTPHAHPPATLMNREPRVHELRTGPEALRVEFGPCRRVRRDAARSVVRKSWSRTHLQHCPTPQLTQGCNKSAAGLRGHDGRDDG